MAQKWAIFTSLKAKKTAQTKPYKTTLHTNKSREATGSKQVIERLNTRPSPITDAQALYSTSRASAPLKLCVALYGSVCSNRHSWHIRLATMSKSHLHRFICEDLLTLLLRRDILYKASPKTTSSASNTHCERIKQKRKIKKDFFCNRLTQYTNVGS